MPRRNIVKVFNLKRQFIRYVSLRDAFAMVNTGEAEPIHPKNFAVGVVLASRRLRRWFAAAKV